ncbi:hypothetical protein C8R43DRAFT_948908 [Mycena crocata]|nr:hypothetical protein C8R43DRAFT_948908 [Mycena crocata]
MANGCQHLLPSDVNRDLSGAGHESESPLQHFCARCSSYKASETYGVRHVAIILSVVVFIFSVSEMSTAWGFGPPSILQLFVAIWADVTITVLVLLLHMGRRRNTSRKLGRTVVQIRLLCALGFSWIIFIIAMVGLNKMACGWSGATCILFTMDHVLVWFLSIARTPTFFPSSELINTSEATAATHSEFWWPSGLCTGHEGVANVLEYSTTHAGGAPYTLSACFTWTLNMARMDNVGQVEVATYTYFTAVFEAGKIIFKKDPLTRLVVTMINIEIHHSRPVNEQFPHLSTQYIDGSHPAMDLEVGCVVLGVRIALILVFNEGGFFLPASDIALVEATGLFERLAEEWVIFGKGFIVHALHKGWEGRETRNASEGSRGLMAGRFREMSRTSSSRPNDFGTALCFDGEVFGSAAHIYGESKRQTFNRS